EFRSGFRAPSRKFKILAIPNVFSYRKSYEHGFTKKYDGPKLCAKSSFNQFFMHRLENSKYWPFPTYSPMGSRSSTVREKMRRSYTLRKIACEVKFRSIFHAPSQKFKILVIPNVLAHGSRMSMISRKNATVINFVFCFRKNYNITCSRSDYSIELPTFLRLIKSTNISTDYFHQY
ncbi:hypothetical protein B296_00020370, partial [Ensete ventricosum]